MTSAGKHLAEYLLSHSRAGELLTFPTFTGICPLFREYIMPGLMDDDIKKGSDQYGTDRKLLLNQ